MSNAAYMPQVLVASDPDQVFCRVREAAAGQGWQPPDRSRRYVVLVTPQRENVFIPCPPAGSMSAADVAEIKQFFPPNGPKNVAVIAPNDFSPPFDEIEIMNSIPFSGLLMAGACLGHNVWVFEGHPSAFVSGTRDSDILLIDSMMRPLLQDGWAAAAKRVMRPRGTIIEFDRSSRNLNPIAPSTAPKGWQYTEPDGEISYANCLFITLARAECRPVRINSGDTLPNLAELTTDPVELDWIAGLPFEYGQLNAEEVINIILRGASWQWHEIVTTTQRFDANVATRDAGYEPFSFVIVATETRHGHRELVIEKSDDVEWL